MSPWTPPKTPRVATVATVPEDIARNADVFYRSLDSLMRFGQEARDHLWDSRKRWFPSKRRREAASEISNKISLYFPDNLANLVAAAAHLAAAGYKYELIDLVQEDGATRYVRAWINSDNQLVPYPGRIRYNLMSLHDLAMSWHGLTV